MGVSTGKEQLTVRIDPKLLYIIDIICDIDRITRSELFERAFWGYEDAKYDIDYSPNRVEEPAEITDYVPRHKINATLYIDGDLHKIINKGAEKSELGKVDVIEQALWDYVESEGFEREPVTDDLIKISIALPGRFKSYKKMKG